LRSLRTSSRPEPRRSVDQADSNRSRPSGEFDSGQSEGSRDRLEVDPIRFDHLSDNLFWIHLSSRSNFHVGSDAKPFY
jgi:hypothetical protein